MTTEAKTARAIHPSYGDPTASPTTANIIFHPEYIALVAEYDADMAVFDRGYRRHRARHPDPERHADERRFAREGMREIYMRAMRDLYERHGLPRDKAALPC